MPDRLSAIDAISPAFRHTKELLFKPFRLGAWLRLALLGLLTGEFSGGGSSGSSIKVPASMGGSGSNELYFMDLSQAALVIWTVLLILLALILILLLLYISSVCRFILFEAVLSDRWRLREGWRRWQGSGWRFFLWQLVLIAAAVTFLVAVVGVPVLIAFSAGILSGPGRSPAAIVLGAILLLFALLSFVLVMLVVALFARDFVVPIMALEGVGVTAGWSRFLPRLRAEPLAYAGYIVMKIVLAVGSAIIFGILSVILVLFLVLFLGVLGAVVVLAGMAAGLTWNAAAIAVTVAAGVMVLALVLYLVAFISTPAVVFFQAFMIHYYGSRYQQLAERLAAGPFQSSLQASVSKA